MKDFFRGWRRKVGVVTLVIACLFAAGWVRSLRNADTINIPPYYECGSVNGGLFWETQFSTIPNIRNVPHGLSCYSVSSFLCVEDAPDNVPRWRFLGFGAGEYGIILSQRRIRYEDLETFRMRYWRFPYWFVIAPLTAISAFLLLTIPRKSIQKKLPEPTSNEGGGATS